MKNGKPLKPASIDKFLTIHKLFDHGHFKLDMKKGPTESGNANDVWVYVQKHLRRDSCPTYLFYLIINFLGQFYIK